ncbi:MAG: hypothetical protein PHP03_00230 [Candidatus Pacebacteria bacterium]|nr:hypothetical protein [Candidatus Paceibacterota bacterium]
MNSKKGFSTLKVIVLVVIILAIGGGVYYWQKNKTEMQESKNLSNKEKYVATQESKDPSNKKEENISLAKDLPICPVDTSTLFTKPFMDGDKPDYITPLGNSNETGHVVPVDHVYPTDNGYEENVTVYAPGNLTLIWVENKQMHNKDTGAITAADYQLNFAPCRGLNLAFIHLKTLSDRLKKAIGDENSNCNNDQKMDYGIQNGIPTYYVTCHPDIQKIKISAGEIIGYFSGQSDKSNSGFDIGMYDYNKPALGFINPDRYYKDTVHTACFADYYIPELKAKYEEKFGAVDKPLGQYSTFIRRIIPPVCGKVMWDVAGTASGNWFKNPIKQVGINDNDALVLIHDNIQPEMAKMSWANVTSFIFAPTHNGSINREFSEVTADGEIYCYQREENINSGNNGSKFLLQLVDDTHIKAERQPGVCGTSESFINPFTYER